jgi:hypothetical protein
LLTGCSNVSTESKPSPTATSNSSNAVESGIALQEKAKTAAKTLEQDPLAGQDVPEMK